MLAAVLTVQFGVHCGAADPIRQDDCWADQGVGLLGLGVLWFIGNIVYGIIWWLTRIVRHCPGCGYGVTRTETFCTQCHEDFVNSFLRSGRC